MRHAVARHHPKSKKKTMWTRFISATGVAALALAITAQVAQAEDEIHEGKVMSVSDSKITVLDKRVSENDTFMVTAETKIIPQWQARKAERHSSRRHGEDHCHIAGREAHRQADPCCGARVSGESGCGIN
jgi:hypothetical protein